MVGAVVGEALGGPPGHLGGEFETLLRRVLDPANARRSLHWGRSYLYESSWPWPDPASAPVRVVVKQFRHDSLKARLRRRRRGSRAELSFFAAQALLERGINTPQPLLYAESTSVAGPAWYVCRKVENALELRYVLRALNGGDAATRFPGIDGAELLRRVGALAAELHRHGIWFRDLTSGNVLLSAPRTNAELLLVDLNRARFRRRLSVSQRMRDLSRMPILSRSYRAEYLRGYQPAGMSLPVRAWFGACHHGFRLKIRSKDGTRRGIRRLADLLLPRRRAHPHIRDVGPGVGAQDRAVWDPLTDQPFQQATRRQRLGVRLLDVRHHLGPLLRGLPPLAASLVEAKRVRRSVERETARVRLRGVGVAIGPGSAGAAELLTAVDDLAVDTVLLRFHLWQGVDEDLLRLARSLAAPGRRPLDLVFQLGQDRSLVKDLDLWRRRVESAVHQLAPYGRRFLIGQAPNRSKWGIWRPREYWRLFEAAAQVVQSRLEDACLLAPAVIDFEPHATASLIFSGCAEQRFDVLANQLYVDRRGAPENPQLGFDLAGKLAVLRSLARRSPDCASGRSWVTEFNWPLREGPHSPAGREVAVGEDAQANYLVRYILEALGTGLAERVYWWQLAAAGYGLLDPRGEGLRQRPAYLALRQLLREVGGAELERLRMPEGMRGYRCRTPGRDVRVLWSVDDRGRRLEIADPTLAVRDRDGRPLDEAPERFGPAPVYVECEPCGGGGVGT